MAGVGPAIPVAEEAIGTQLVLVRAVPPLDHRDRRAAERYLREEYLKIPWGPISGTRAPSNVKPVARRSRDSGEEGECLEPDSAVQVRNHGFADR
jgi:hypothetical protein